VVVMLTLLSKDLRNTMSFRTFLWAALADRSKIGIGITLVLLALIPLLKVIFCISILKCTYL